MAINRQLAAILFTDIEGYTSLMQQDEQKAIAMKDRHREIFQKTHQQYNGRIIRYYGDGTLSIFQSAIDAVKCAVAMQQTFVHWPQIPVRIGLHTGDITIEDEDVFGDGVNLASRIESLGVAGSVLISDKVNDEIHNHPELKTVSTGTYHLKNVERPVEVFAILGEGLVIPKHGSLKGKTEEKKFFSSSKQTKKISARTITIASFVLIALITGGYFILQAINKEENKTLDKWLAILPFRLISNDTSFIWLSDGFTEELTSSIAGISDLKVKSPTTMLQYRNSNKTARQIAEELNVTNIIDGSLQKEGNNIIINARLINPLTDEIKKNFKFRKDASEIKFIYSEVAQQIADVLNVTLTSEEKKRLQQTAKVDPEIYNLYLQGMSLAKKFNYLDGQEAIKNFDKAIKKDSNFAPVLAGKAFAIMSMAAWYATISVTEAIKQTDPLFDKSIALDSSLSLAYSSRGWLECLNWDFKNSEKSFLKSFSIDPSDDIGLSGLIFVNLFGGNFREAQKWGETGKAISPNSWWVDVQQGMTLYFRGKIPEAIKHNQDGMAKYDHILFYDKLGWLYNLNGQYKEAIEILEKEVKKFNARPTSSLAWLASSYYKNGDKEKAQLIFNELENRVSQGVPNTAVYTAMVYASIGKKEKAFTFLDKSYELHDVDMIWLKEDPHFKPIHNEPRYKEMLKKVGFE